MAACEGGHFCLLSVTESVFFLLFLRDKNMTPSIKAIL